MRTVMATAFVSLLILPAFGQDGDVPAVDVQLKLQDGSNAGSVVLTQTPQGVLLEHELVNLEDREHAIHLHETGTCEGDFSSAGGHYNPTGNEHGYMVEAGFHAGDMPNFTAENGGARFDHLNPNVSLGGEEAPLDDDDGTALVIHARGDDYQSQPSGDAGDRVACGIVYPAG